MNKWLKSDIPHRQIGVADAFIEDRLALGRVAFSLDEIIKKTGLSVIAAKNQLRRLAGKVVRVSPRQRFFLIISPEHRTMGAPRQSGGCRIILIGLAVLTISLFSLPPVSLDPIRRHCRLRR